jgi:RHS repeat-associated protein
VTPTPIVPNGQVWKFYYYAGSVRIAEREASQYVNRVYYLFSDHLGSTNVVSDSNGVIVALMLYKAWGETRYVINDSPTDYGYTGQREESGIGLYYYNARWYDPALGRFIQADTIVPGAGNPIAWDRYAYVMNNPINEIDPSGHTYCDFGKCQRPTRRYIIKGWDDSYKFTQDGNTCAVASTAVSLSILLGHPFTQKDIQRVFPLTYVGIGVPPYFQQTGINQIFPLTLFPGTIQASYTHGTREDLLNNLHNGYPTMVNIALPRINEVGHVLVVIGYDPSTNQLIFYNPAYDAVQDEKTILDIYNEGRGFKSFDELWAASFLPFIPSNSMVTVSKAQPIPVLSIGSDYRQILNLR